MESDPNEDEGSPVDQTTVVCASPKTTVSAVPEMTAVMVDSDLVVSQSIELNGDAIYLNYRQLHTLPADLFTQSIASALRRLYVKHNFLHSLPEEIKLFQGLAELYLHTNKLVSLPRELFELRSLEMLAVSDNQLRSLPAAVGHLENLKRLQLSKNKLTQLPKEIGQLKQLQVLEVNENCLCALPAQIAGCTSLRRLCLDSNALIALPRQLCNLTNLTEISACDNQLVCLPQNLGRMPALETVYVDNNPYLKTVPASTLRKTIGFFKSGKSNIPDRLLRQFQVLTFETGPDEHVITVPLPGELRSVGHICTNCVPLLQELSLRVVYRKLQRSDAVLHDIELPLDLISHLDTLTAHCQHCTCEIFVSAFPMIFRAQVQACDLLLLGLCCSAGCVRQCSLIVNLPLVYPRLEDLALALVLA